MIKNNKASLLLSPDWQKVVHETSFQLEYINLKVVLTVMKKNWKYCPCTQICRLNCCETGLNRHIITCWLTCVSAASSLLCCPDSFLSADSCSSHVDSDWVDFSLELPSSVETAVALDKHLHVCDWPRQCDIGFFISWVLCGGNPAAFL